MKGYLLDAKSYFRRPLPFLETGFERPFSELVQVVNRRKLGVPSEGLDRMSLRYILEQLRDFDTATLANTIGYIDPTPPNEFYMGGTIRSLTPSLEPTVGVAFTCELDTSTPETTVEDDKYKQKLDGFYQQLDDMSKRPEPSIWVVKTMGSRPDHECVLGDGMAKALFASGCVGAVTDGGVRDVKGLLTIPFAAYARGTTIHHCALRFQSFNQPVEVGGIWVRAGDVIHANCEGVIRVPRACLEALPGKAVRMSAFERDAHCVLRRTDLEPFEKKRRVAALLENYGFGPGAPAPR